MYHSLPHPTLSALLDNIAALVIPLFAHRFPAVGSLYFGPSPGASSPQPLQAGSSIPTPTLTSVYFSFGVVSPLSPAALAAQTPRSAPPHPEPYPYPAFPSSPEFHVGQIISWPFFGSNRGDLAHPAEIDRGPWRSARAHLDACGAREVRGVIRENEGKAAPHRLHLDPDEIRASRHHHLQAVPEDESDESDEWELEESEEEWDGPGDAMYRDYRRMQRSTFLVAHLHQREAIVRGGDGAVGEDDGEARGRCRRGGRPRWWWWWWWWWWWGRGVRARLPRSELGERVRGRTRPL